MTVIVTGAAGYIGAHIATALLTQGAKVIGIDDLSTGRIDFISPEIEFYQGDVRDEVFLTKVFSRIKNPEESGVIHCAGVKFPEESLQQPTKYFDINTNGTLKLLKVMAKFQINSIVFSSSCSVYGNPTEDILISENSNLKPVSPYGYSKLLAEIGLNVISQYSNLSSVSLRYFNVAGNNHDKAYDSSMRNLMPSIYRSVTSKSIFTVFGDDYPTLDGSCVRDYVHVSDLADAHIAALARIVSGKPLLPAYNLGSSTGYSVFEIVNSFKEFCQPKFDFQVASRRPGDPAQIYADISAANSDLDWRPKFGLNEIIQSGWVAWNHRIS
jgi:UDP-glucose 4-epimerase